MTRMFYRIEDKIYFDPEAFIRMAEDNTVGLDDLYNIFEVDTTTGQRNLIEV